MVCTCCRPTDRPTRRGGERLEVVCTRRALLGSAWRSSHTASPPPSLAWHVLYLCDGSMRRSWRKGNRKRETTTALSLFLSLSLVLPLLGWKCRMTSPFGSRSMCVFSLPLFLVKRVGEYQSNPVERNKPREIQFLSRPSFSPNFAFRSL